MKILSDTNLFINFSRNLPVPDEVEKAFDDDRNELFLSTYSIIEIFRLWKVGRLPDNPDGWLNLALPYWTLIPVSFSIARQTAIWNWEHCDPADRAICATALEDQIPLWHTDSVIKKLSGFPHKYFAPKSE